MSFDGHPDAHRLAAFAAGRIDAAAAIAIENHLVDCPSCANSLASGVGVDNLSAELNAALRAEPVEISVLRGSIIANRYRLISPIGHGGMGTVWNADQLEPLQREVAIKIVNEGMDSGDGLRRFEAERHALAQMDHPNIARVWEAGTFGRGRPFIVMELVRGGPITDYCNHHVATPRQRLELFVLVCQAIQHAHQKGVIHRDIKPSNVLVAEYDGQPVPKVIDFGVAKITRARPGGGAAGTLQGAIVGTPEYMSPEQASFGGEDIDTRSDVYALGALLYELLTGEPPFGRTGPSRQSITDLLRAIREDDPQKPSSRVGVAAPGVAVHCAMEPGRLAKLVRGELDWIVMRALEKNRSQRYATASELGQDVSRYLSGDPIQAAPHTAAYRLRKFAHKNRGAMVAACLVAAALVAGVTGTTVGLVRARAEETRARGAEADAKDQARVAEAAADAERRARHATSAVHADLIWNLIDFTTRHRHSTPDSLEQALTRRLLEIENWIEQARIDDPAQIFELRARACDAFRVLGDLPRALQQGVKALDIAEATFGATDANTVGSSLRLAEIHRLLGNVEDAVEFGRRGRGAFAGMALPTTPREESAQHGLMLYLREWTKETGLAVALAERLTADADRRGKPDALRSCRGALAFALAGDGQIERAIEIQRDVLREAERQLGASGCKPYAYNAQQLLINLSRFDAAIYADVNRILGEADVHPSLLAVAGLHYMNERRWTEAEPILRRCVTVRQRQQPEDWTTFNAVSLLGGCLLGQGNTVEAESLLLAGHAGMKQRAEAIPTVAKARLTQAVERLVDLYTRQGRPEEADKWRALISAP